MLAEMTPSGLDSRKLAALYAALSLIVLAPVLTVPFPCLGDTLNHLARIHILATIGHAPWLQSLYDPHAKLVPYLGMDAPVAALAAFMPIYQAGRIFAAICILAPVLAAAALRRAAAGRVGAAPCLAFLLCYNYQLQRGFLTYLFGMLLALLLFAAWVATAPRPGWRPDWHRDWHRDWRRAALFSLPLLLVFLAHSFAAAAYCLLVAGHELGLAWRARLQPWRAILLRWAAAAAQILPALALAAWLATRGHEVTRSHFRVASAADQLGALLSPVYFAGNPATLPVIAFAIALALVYGRKLRLAPSLWPAAGLVALVACVTPSVLFDVTWGVNLRLPLVAAIVLIASLGLAQPIGLWPRRAILACITALALTTSFSARAMLAALNQQVTTMRILVSVLPRGARLLVLDMPTACATNRVAPRDMTGHLSFVAAIDRDAFIPFLFTGTTPLQVLPALRNSASPISEAISEAQLADGLVHTDPSGGPPEYGWGGHKYWLGWPTKFDFLLVQHFGCPGFQPPAVVALMAQSPIADLYRITRQ